MCVRSAGCVPYTAPELASRKRCAPAATAKSSVRLVPATIDMFDSGQLILDAAAQGLGIAFMFEMHLEGAHDPRLAPLFGVSAESAYAYWFACRHSALGRRPVRLFHDWLIDSL